MNFTQATTHVLILSVIQREGLYRLTVYSTGIATMCSGLGRLLSSLYLFKVFLPYGQKWDQVLYALFDSDFSAKLKFIHSEKATKFCEIFPLLLTPVHLNYYLSNDVCVVFLRLSVCPKKNFLMVAHIKKCQYTKLSHF